MLTFESHGQEINRLHLLAHAAANDAMEHAKAAGVLLLEMKNRLKHGQFQHWVLENAQVSLRQAQRYMAAAQGKTIPLRMLIEKNDTVSLLEGKCNKLVAGDGKWQPNCGHIYIYSADVASYWVVPDLSLKGFHVSKHYEIELDPAEHVEQYADPDDYNDKREWDGVSKCDGTIHPIKPEFVGLYLNYLGLKDPNAVNWHSGPHKGMARQFGESETK